MPLYDYQCHACSCPYEAQVKIKDRKGIQCPECDTPNDPKITFQGALVGVETSTTIGSKPTVAWSHAGMWGKVRNEENRHLKQTRDMIEGGAYKSARGRVRQSALTYLRCYEMAKQRGMDAEAASIEGRMARLNELRTKQIERPDAPEELPGGIKREMGAPIVRKVKRKVDTPDGKRDTTVTEVTQPVKYTT